VYWYKDAVPKDVLEKVRNHSMIDVSIGFTFDREDVSGDFEGQHYDYKQTNIFLNHLAAPIPAGRCPGPVCGLGVDSKPKVNPNVITLDAASVKDCPICKQIIDVGLHETAKRLYLAYGMDETLTVLQGKPLVKPAPTQIDEAFAKVLKEFNQNQQTKL
jgi:hypothetical protein